MTEYRNYPPSIAMSDYCSKHVMAMTVEELHSKADIAKELAYRDSQLDDLAAKLEIARTAIERHIWSGHDQDRELRNALAAIAGKEVAK